MLRAMKRADSYGKHATHVLQVNYTPASPQLDDIAWTCRAESYTTATIVIWRDQSHQSATRRLVKSVKFEGSPDREQPGFASTLKVLQVDYQIASRHMPKGS